MPENPTTGTAAAGRDTVNNTWYFPCHNCNGFLTSQVNDLTPLRIVFHQLKLTLKIKKTAALQRETYTGSVDIFASQILGSVCTIKN